ncbi:NucA/NucB deoxyribonuclease domain-containing protein [Streptomyces sp. NPDC014846]|uniref:NucA/NucB deoxyribonuclease domain-containing protein n=1 Tax=Streptomyces sp. NPDC014846 TaxID=3364922 RepID=UPI0036F8EE7D
MKLRRTITAGAIALSALSALAVGAGAPSAADQQDSGTLRVTIGRAVHQTSTSAVTAPGANASCSINHITVNRYSECEWITIHVDVVKIVRGQPVLQGTADFDVKHQMTLKAKSINWSEKFDISKAKTTRAGKGLHVNIAASSKSGTKAKVHFDQGRTLDSKSSGSVDYKTDPIKKGKVNAKTKTTYKYTFTKAGYERGTVSYDSAVYRCDNYYGTSGCAIPESATGVPMINQPLIAFGIKQLRNRGGHYGDPYGGKPLHWMINDKQKKKNRSAVCPKKPPADMERAGRTSCDEYPFASTYEGGTHLPAKQRTITWVGPRENDSQGATITNWRRAWHVMDHDPFFVII